MPIEYEHWSPIEDMPGRFLDAWVESDYEGTSVLLLPFGTEARALNVRFEHVLAHAVYDEYVFALSDIEYGLPGVSTFIVKNYDWPASHLRYEAFWGGNLHCYRFGSEGAIIDVLAAGVVSASWVFHKNG